MKRQTNRMFSILLTLVMLLTLLTAPAQAATRPFFSVQPQAGTAVKENGYPIAWKTITQAPVYWMYLNPNSSQWAAGDVLKENPATLPYNAAHCLDNGTGLYKLVAVANGTQHESDPFQVTWVDGYAVTVNGGSGSGRYLEGDSVTITANAPETGKTFKEWDGADGLTFTEGSATTATATFTMPAKNVVLTATYQRVKPDTTVVRPAGSGTADDPFRIGTVGELYWFTGFTNNYVAVNDTFDVERNEAHAILMNDITVNPDLLTDSYGLGVEASLLASWSPISYLEPYCGTFDGNGHTISGLYYCEISSFQTFAFIAEMGEGGVIKNLTLEDTYFYPELNSYFSTDMPCAAGIVGIAGEGTVENCHFDGVVGAGSTSYYGGGAGGIAWSTRGVIQNCTAKGRVIGQASFDDNAGGAKVGGIVGAAYGTAVVSNCINDAEVTCWDNDTAWGSAGGIVGYLAGTVRDCRNRGVISGRENNYAGGIVGRAAGEADQYAVISRCWNEANFTGSGIVDYIHSGINGEGYTIVKNCYNAGSVTNGIVGKGWGDGISIAYCHNWGTVADAPIYKVKYVGDTTVVENCFYRDIAETDSMDGTTFKTTEEFASSLGFVTKMLNAGNNGNWKQGGDYPILNKMFTLTVNGGTGSGVYGEGIEVTISATVPDGKVFASWSGTEGLTFTDDTDKFSETATFTMPNRNVELTAIWEDIPLTFVAQPKNGTSEKAKPCTFSWQLSRDDATVRLMVYNSGEKKWETLSDDLTGKTSASYAFAGGTYCTGNETQLKLSASIGSDQIESDPFIIVWKDFLTYSTWVLGRPITEENMADVLGDGKISYTPAQGTAPAKLTLNGVYIDKPDISGARSPIDSEEDLIIEFKGDNTVNGRSVAAINSTRNLYLQSDGTGSLTAYGPNYVIWTHDMSMSISGLKELNLSNKNAIFSALYASGGITISDCGTVISNNAIDAGNMDLRLQNSKIQIQATWDGDPEAAVLRAGRKLTISNAQIEITAASESVKNKFSGIYTERGELTISAGSTVSMTDVKNGIVGGYTIAISDSDVSVSSSECAIRCSASQNIELTGCAINTTKTPAEISGYRVVKPDTEEIATDVVIERTSEVTKYKVTVNVNNSKWGSVQVFGLDSDGKVDAGSAVTLRATAKVGCRFVGWKVGDTYLSHELEYAAVITEPTTITAEFTDELVYDTYIMGVQVSSKNMNDVLGDGKVSYVPAQGTIPAILTLKGVDLTYETSPVYTQEDLTVEVRGKNKLKSTNAHGIELNRMDKNLYINGNSTGSLTIESYNNGITSRLGKVYLNGLKELDITAGIDHSKFWGEDGIYTFSGLSIKDCALIRANNYLSSGNGEGQVIIKMTIDNSRVEVRMPEKGETQTYTYSAIRAPEGLEIINGSYVLVEASNPTGNNMFDGIYAAYDEMEISDSHVKVKDAVKGIYGGEDITINRSHIYLEASECALRSFGDMNDPDCYYIKLNGCELTMPGTKLLTTVRDDYDDITQVVDADTEQPALKCSIGTTISEIKILGFTPPTNGAVLDKTNVHRGYTDELASYRVSTNAWYRVDPATGTNLPMNNGDVFEIGNTYCYKALIVQTDEAFDAFPTSAENLTVTIEGLPAGCEMNVYFNSAGTVLTCDVLFVLETTISGEVTVTGTSATASVTVKELSGKAILIVAQYSGGQMKAVQTVPVTEDGTFAPANPFTHAEGCTYKAFLVNADTYAPLCAAAPLSE